MILAAATAANASSGAVQFKQARPFRHLVLEDFFETAFLQRLLAEFPAFERGNARNEAGELGAKSVVEQIAKLGPAFAELDALIQSSEFLGLVGTLTGIEDLRYDPQYFGGGTHENRSGQDLDPHVDFNHHPLTGWHRRLNLIVYLNPRWEGDWGGGLELHSDPRAGLDDQVTVIQPLMNRCVIFETTESSWHGFSRISFPDGVEPRSRRSIALYFYTQTRPAEELAPAHSTIYVDRPLPRQIQAGHTLDSGDFAQVQTLLARRDQHIERLYRDIGALRQELESARTRLRMGAWAQLAHYLRRALAILRVDRK